MKSIRVTNRITKRENESFKQYLNEISEIKMFTPEEEADCLNDWFSLFVILFVTRILFIII
jgi:hypothetical protein